MSREKLRKLGLDLPILPDLHRRQLPEARLPDRGPGAGHAQRHHEDRARSAGAQGHRVLGGRPGGARPRRAGGRRAVPRRHGRVLRRDDARLRQGRPRPLLRQPLLPQAGDGRSGALAGSHDRRLVAVDAVAHVAPGEGHADRAVHADGLVLRRPLPGPPDAPASRWPARSGRRSRPSSRPAYASSRSTSPRSRSGPTSWASPSRRCTSRSTGCAAYYVVHACFGAFETIYPGFSTCRSTTSISRSRTAPSTSWGCSRRTRSPRTSRSGCSTSTRTPWRRPTTSRPGFAAAPPCCRPTASGSIPTAASRPAPWRRAAPSSAAMMAAVRAARAELG